MDISKITNPQAKMFIETFLANRNINREFYKRVPEDNFDFRMVDTPKRKSDSPRESLIHQIDATRDYINGVRTGVLLFDNKYDDLDSPEKLSKTELLKKLEETEQELVEVVADPEIGGKKVKVPWSNKPVSAIDSLWGLDSHEVLHTGWNLAIMDHLGIKRFSALKRTWG